VTVKAAGLKCIIDYLNAMNIGACNYDSCVILQEIQKKLFDWREAL